VAALDLKSTADYILACDYTNSKFQHWASTLAILCDRERFDFLAYDSGCRHISSSEMTAGVLDVNANEPNLFVTSLKKKVLLLVIFLVLFSTDNFSFRL
jgi:hypothetical protein